MFLQCACITFKIREIFLFWKKLPLTYDIDGDKMHGKKQTPLMLSIVEKQQDDCKPLLKQSYLTQLWF